MEVNSWVMLMKPSTGWMRNVLGKRTSSKHGNGNSASNGHLWLIFLYLCHVWFPEGSGGYLPWRMERTCWKISGLMTLSANHALAIQKYVPFRFSQFAWLWCYHHPKHHKMITKFAKPLWGSKHDLWLVATNPARFAKITVASAPVVTKQYQNVLQVRERILNAVYFENNSNMTWISLAIRQ